MNEPFRRGEDHEPLIGADPGRLQEVKPHELLLRFVFGAGISLAAGLVSILVNPIAGGMFLAFPAILPATITLIEKRDGTAEAVTDVEGAVIGASALLPFAAAAGFLLRRTGAPLALIIALIVWLLTALAVYFLLEIPLRRAQEAAPTPHDRGRDQAGRGVEPAVAVLPHPVGISGDHGQQDDQRRR